jgi:hypothetical protein
MTGQRRVEESENAKFKYRFHEVSQSIKLAAPRQEAALAKESEPKPQSRTHPWTPS